MLAVQAGLIQMPQAVIHITVNAKKRSVTIRDNGTGISSVVAVTRLLNVGASDKDGIAERGFRGIGRLGGLAYADEVRFITSAVEESTKTIMICNCIRMQELLQKSNTETSDVMETFRAISRFETQPEDADEHYFEVQLYGVTEDSGLLNGDSVKKYLAETAPVDFNGQEFIQASKVRDFFNRNGHPITNYKILWGSRKLPIYKLYSRYLTTGKQERTKNKDGVRDVEFVCEKLKDVYCNAVRTAFRHGIKEISNYILFNYMDKPEDLYERLRINIELNEELGIQIFSFPMRFSPIDRTDRDHIGVHWKYRKYLQAISAILHVTKGVVAAGTSFFEAAFGKTQEEYFEILAMPREMIIHRYYYRDNGTTARWRELYHALTEDQKDQLMQMVSYTVGELRSMPCPDEFKEILPFYLLKYSGEKSSNEGVGRQLSLLEDGDSFDDEQ